MEFLAVISVGILIWMAWQLYRAKKFNNFKRHIHQVLKSQVINHIIAELESTRSDDFPNNETHQQATIHYWTESTAKILQAALIRDIINKQWLKNTGNWRNSQHLFFIERNSMH